jgi:outer membrane protein OmpA-like peptidoglycan-associated protein
MRTLVFLLYMLFFPSVAFSQILIDTCNTPQYIVRNFIHDNHSVRTFNIRYTGNKFATGVFINYCKDLPLAKGIILSTGNSWDVIGPNDRQNNGTNNYGPGDKALETLAQGKTFDAASLEFDFEANSDSISFEYIFASEEYPEYVNKGVNDVFGFFVTDKTNNTCRNIAVCNQLPVSINTINDKTNSQYYVSNSYPFRSQYGCLRSDLQFDGLTTKLTAGIKLTPYHIYHIKLSIADVGDSFYDSAVLLNANSFGSTGKTEPDSLVNKKLYTDLYQDAIIKTDGNSLRFMPNAEFETNSYAIRTEMNATLNNIAEILNRYFDYKIEITGYTDNTGSADKNKKLSVDRAESVARYLKQKGIAGNRLTIIGAGAANPLADNTTENGRAKNRRVCVRLYK